jgi:hypothetical protein
MKNHQEQWTLQTKRGLNPTIADNDNLTSMPKLSVTWLSTTGVTHPAANTRPVAAEFSSCMLTIQWSTHHMVDLPIQILVARQN